MYFDGGETEPEGEAYAEGSATRTSEMPSENGKVRGARVEEEAPVRALRVDSLVSADERWRRSWWVGGEGLEKAEGGERGRGRGVSTEGGLRAGSIGREETVCMGSRARSASSPCLMLAGGEGGGGPTGFTGGRKETLGTSVDTTCMSAVL